MLSGKEFKIRVRVIVKAFPQPSKQHEETVCCAGIREDTQELVRLYPIRYRRLPQNKRFNRYDLVEMTVTKAVDDRPESYHVREDSISTIERATKSNFNDNDRVLLWRPHIYESLAELEEAQKERHISLGIIKPYDPAFECHPIESANEDMRKLIAQQRDMFQEPLKPLDPPKYHFRYHFTSGGIQYSRTIMDWEAQAAYYNFKRQYGPQAFEMLEDQYANQIPKQNLHFVMGTLFKRKYQFILIGLLRSTLSPEDAVRQGFLF